LILSLRGLFSLQQSKSNFFFIVSAASIPENTVAVIPENVLETPSLQAQSLHTEKGKRAGSSEMHFKIFSPNS